MSRDNRHSSGVFVNFSTPQRSQSVKSIFHRRKSTCSKEEDVLPYRPVKAKFVQYHVTTDDYTAPKRPSIDQLRQPVIPERTTSLSRKTSTWVDLPSEARAGAFKFGVPTLVKTPWEADRNRPGSRWSRNSERPRPISRRPFVQLPREIYQCIIDHLEGVHSDGESLDLLGLRHDLRSLCLVGKTWQRIAREHLYRDLWLPSNKTPAKRKWSRQQARSRLRQLHDVLANAPGLAFLVHRLHLTGELADEIAMHASSPSRKDSALDLLQSIIRKCYNLERLCGFVIPATLNTIPLLEALASRTRLREHAWSLDSTKAALPGLGDFIWTHEKWLNLETLVISADEGVDLGQVAIAAVLTRLPSLRHLMVSRLHLSDFHNGTLPLLPALKSLRLERLAGVTDRGVEQLAFARLAPSLEQLSLIGLELVSLQTIGTLLSHLTRLRRLAVVQDTSPEAQTGVKFVSRRIAFESTSLRYLHWDCLVPGSALSYFAEGIESARFPNLLEVKVPCDYDGKIQALCRPIPRIKLMPEDLEYLDLHTQIYERDLKVAHIQAQLRVRESRQQPLCNVVVQDESMEVQRTHVFGSFLGSMDSKIVYSLQPAAGTSALAMFSDIAWPMSEGAPGSESLHGLSMLFGGA